MRDSAKRKGIKLLHAKQIKMTVLTLASRRQEIVIDFARTEDEFANRLLLGETGFIAIGEDFGGRRRGFGNDPKAIGIPYAEGAISASLR